MVLEVLSPSTEAHDCAWTLEQYRQLPSLQAYVLVSQKSKSIEHFARRPDGTWLLTAVESGELTIPSLNATLSVDAVYERVEFTGDEDGMDLP